MKKLFIALAVLIASTSHAGGTEKAKKLNRSPLKRLLRSAKESEQELRKLRKKKKGYIKMKMSPEKIEAIDRRMQRVFRDFNRFYSTVTSGNTKQ